MSRCAPLARVVLLACAALALLASGSLASTLRSEVRVIGPLVTIGDFYPDAGIHAAVPLFRSPDLGTRGSVSAQTVAERARAAGFSAAGTDGLRTVLVERLAMSVGLDQIREAVRATLLARHPGLEPEALEIELTGLRAPVLVDAGTAEPVTVVDIDWTRATGQLRVVASLAAAEGPRSVTLTGSALETIEVYTTAQPIERGTVVSEDHLVVQRVPRQRLAARQVTDGREIIGLAARRSIQAGRPLFRSDFEEPLLVRRGDRVTMVYRVGGLTLTTIGQATENGARDAMVNVINLQSRRTVTAIVRGKDQVEVGFAQRRLAQFQETIR